MSIKTQKILRFIPIVNFVTMFAWINLCFKKSVKQFDYIKNLIKMFLLIILITAVRIVCSFVFKNEMLDSIIMYISIYFYLLSMSFVSVKAQEDILAKDTQQT